MDLFRGSTVTAPPTAKPEGKKLRRRLQKIGSQQRSYQANDLDAKRGRLQISKASWANNHHAKKAILPDQPCLPLPKDLDDGAWLEQLRKSGYLCQESTPAPWYKKSQRRPCQNVVPEFAHLSMHDAGPGNLSEEASRPSLSNPSSTPSSTVSSSRRYAKTPVHRIGQLENREEKVSSVELIAESYRALLESRCSLLEEREQEPTPEPSPLPYNESYEVDGMRHDHHLETVVEVPEPLNMTGSPRSDDGTLVAFEEDTIYFKPVSLTPNEPLSPVRERAKPEPEDGMPPLLPSPEENPGLQICFDLLMRELSSAVSGSSTRPAAETSELQVWVMIEAYEKLRDEVLGSRLEGGQRSAVEGMFDMWLNALYVVHDRMTGRDDQRSESNYEELEQEDLD
ncbi:hypothetical protein F4778DRAFT_721736 [Xylariomycetidae sp. FL2044]|nr:hypothetical protein F4778DRAFT_721736 [Xylariomycetidae sp. FL2044]